MHHFFRFNSLEEQGKLFGDRNDHRANELCAELGYIDEKGNFNFNDWFSANMSGTTENGNDFGSVWDSFRKHGVLPQKGATKAPILIPIKGWLDRTKLRLHTKKRRSSSLKYLRLSTSWILLGTSNLTYCTALKHAPVHIGTPVCSGWNKKQGGQKCDLPVQHANACARLKAKKVTQIYDHYDPLDKELEWDYPIPYAVKGVLKLKAQNLDTRNPVFVFTKSLSRGK